MLIFIFHTYAGYSLITAVIDISLNAKQQKIIIAT